MILQPEQKLIRLAKNFILQQNTYGIQLKKKPGTLRTGLKKNWNAGIQLNSQILLLTKKQTMKKLFIVFAVAFAFTACNNSAETAADAKDSLDSIANEKKEVIDSTADVKKDVIDSTTEQKKEAIEKLDSLNRKD